MLVSALCYVSLFSELGFLASSVSDMSLLHTSNKASRTMLFKQQYVPEGRSVLHVLY